MIKHFGLLGLALLLCGCADTRSRLQPNVRVIDFPKLNEERTAELGDTIVDKGRLYTFPAVELKASVHSGGVINKIWNVPAGKAVAREEDRGWTYYFADGFTVADPLTGTVSMLGGLAISKTNESVVRVFKAGNAFLMAPTSKPDLEKISVTALDRPAFRQELIYNGRVGNYVKFLYREVSSDITRAALNQEVQYDLNESRDIGFKSARVQIIDATNTQLKYQVLKGFPDP